MQPLNPFLAAFFKHGNPIVSQCSPVHHHILLVPTTDFLLSAREVETGQPTAELLAVEDVLASHVLRIPTPNSTTGQAAGGKDPQSGVSAIANLRDVRGKARQYTTLNGRTIVIKDANVFTSKGFRSIAQAQLLADSIWYPDTLEPRQWLIYYISRPLIGTWEEVHIEPAIFVHGMAKERQAEADRIVAIENGEPSLPRKKEIRNFNELLSNFPLIARQMQSGLEKLLNEFITIFERPLPPPPSATHIPDPLPDGPITAAMRKARTHSVSARRNSLDSQAVTRSIENFFSDDDEHVMRTSMETAVTSAIDIFQAVDKQQLSMLGATTDLTGPLVEALIERYVAEHVHSIIWPRLASMRRQEDLELEAKIRQMEHIDISQLGIFIGGGTKAKQELTMRLGTAVEEFRKMANAACPQDMLDILLSTMKTVTTLTEQSAPDPISGVNSEKPILTINADSLVSLLLYVVIRAGLKHLQARLSYMRHFIFIEDVDSGEMGYALSTFEAVLTYLFGDSSSLRKASRRNKALWDATSKGDMAELRKMMDPDNEVFEEDEPPQSPRSSRGHSLEWSLRNGSRRSSINLSRPGSSSEGSGLSHVFPFQSRASEPAPKKKKRVSMDTRSLSSSSEFSFHSRTASIGTLGSGIEGDISVERLCHTQDPSGESVPMMAVQHGRPEALKYLLSLSDYFPLDSILQDCNNEGTSLLSAAVQLGHTELINILLDFVMSSTDEQHVLNYLALQDSRGRSVAHYLFQAPFLIDRIGKWLNWRQKDKNGQTPLFALCRSYDHSDYQNMVGSGLAMATQVQGDGEPLHLDEHVDLKNNTLLHIVNDPQLAVRILRECDVDVNATNEKKFTPLMLASKYGRYEMVKTLYADPRVDTSAKELRGLTAVELAKDDDVRNRIDDLSLFGLPPGEDGRITGVIRSFFVEDATIRLVLKSGAPIDASSFAVTTCRRSMADFERLANLLALENPASWIPNIATLRSPFQIPSKPSRSVLKDLQVRANAFMKILLSHPTFATHEMLWEFFLVPDLQADMMEQRSRLKAQARAEKVRDEFEPLEDLREVEQFVDHAREMVRGVNYATKSVARRANSVGIAATDLFEASSHLSRGVNKLAFLPESHNAAFALFVAATEPPQSNPTGTLHTSLLALQSTIQAMLSALSRPPKLVSQVAATRRAADRLGGSGSSTSGGSDHQGQPSRASAWTPALVVTGLLDETRQRRAAEERESRARQARAEADDAARELRYSQQTVAAELAGWHDAHARAGRAALRDYARGMLVLERERLATLRRALRRVGGSSKLGSVQLQANGTQPNGTS